MRKFTHQIQINESQEDTYNLKRKIGEFPEWWQEIKDYIELFKETNSYVTSITVSEGYVTNKQSSKITHPQSVVITGLRKMKETFPSGIVPDKWLPTIRASISFNSMAKDLAYYSIIDGRWNDATVEMENLDQMIARINSIKALTKRIQRYGEIKISLSNGGIMGSNTPGDKSQKPDLSIILISE
jgi:hypothetical protein